MHNTIEIDVTIKLKVTTINHASVIYKAIENHMKDLRIGTFKVNSIEMEYKDVINKTT